MDLATLQHNNPGIHFLQLHEATAYADPLLLPEKAAEQLFAAAALVITNRDITKSYEASVSSLEAGPWMQHFTAVFGGLDIQTGWCAGTNRRLNALEYHQSPEIIVALTDLCLLLGLPTQIRNGSFDTADCIALPLSAGTVCVLKPAILHFSPCVITGDSFASLIILPRGTNTLLPTDSSPSAASPKSLFRRNKWLLVHPDSTHLTSQGAIPALTGSNLEIRPA